MKKYYKEILTSHKATKAPQCSNTYLFVGVVSEIKDDILLEDVFFYSSKHSSSYIGTNLYDRKNSYFCSFSNSKFSEAEAAKNRITGNPYVTSVHPKEITTFLGVSGDDFIRQRADERSEKHAQYIKRRNEKKELEKENLFKKLIKEESKGFNNFLFNKLWEPTDAIDSQYFIYDTKEKFGYCTCCKSKIEIKKAPAKHKEKITCPSCKKKVTYLSNGKRKSEISNILYAANINVIDNTLVARFYEVERCIFKNLYHDYENPAFYISEKMRIFITEDSVRNFTQYRSNGKWRELPNEATLWGDNVYQMWNVVYSWNGIGKIYMPNIQKKLSDSGIFKYSGLAEMLKTAKIATEKLGYPIYNSSIEIAEEYVLRKETRSYNEYLSKCGFVRLFIIGNSHYTGRFKVDLSEKTLPNMLGLKKETFHKFQKNPHEIAPIDICIAQKFPDITEEEFEIIKGNNWFNSIFDKYDTIRKYTTLYKLDKYIKKQPKDSRNIRLWVDYINYAEHVLDLTIKQMKKNTAILFPKNLKREHDHFMHLHYELVDKEQREIRDKKASQINKRLAELHKKYDYENTSKQLTVLAPMSGTEIIREGKFQHICVADPAQNYIENMANGIADILFIRKSNKPSKPYYTLEIRDGRIVQCRGFSNRDMTPEVKEFVKEYAREKQLSASF